jgi:nicotinate-nucleotide adenylyltransferase
MARNVGILGGTFDPIHIGHLILAVLAREQLSLDEVLLIPNERSPFKPHAPAASFADRFAMVKLAAHDLPGIVASDIEGQRGGVSYMVDTLRALTSMHTDTAFVLLLGYDALNDFSAWHESEEILSMASLAAVARNGETVENAAVDAKRIDMPRMDVSASEIRQRVKRGLPIDCLTPPAVIGYIRTHHLYA